MPCLLSGKISQEEEQIGIRGVRFSETKQHFVKDIMRNIKLGGPIVQQRINSVIQNKILIKGIQIDRLGGQMKDVSLDFWRNNGDFIIEILKFLIVDQFRCFLVFFRHLSVS